MRRGRGRGEHPDLGDDPANETVTSELGWVRVDCDPRAWIACPLVFPDGYDLDSWATAAFGVSLTTRSISSRAFW